MILLLISLFSLEFFTQGGVFDCDWVALSCYTARQHSLWSNWVEVIVSVPGCGLLCNKSLLSSPTDNKEVVTDWTQPLAIITM